MKYTIEGFNQQAMVVLDLDGTDAIILRWFVDFFATNKMTTVITDNDIEYKWVKYQAVIDDLPILRISNREMIARRFKKLEEALVLEKYIKKSQKGTYSCFRPGPNYEILLESKDETATRLKSRVESALDSKVGCALDSKVEPKDPSITNPSIKSLSKDKDTASDEAEYSDDSNKKTSRNNKKPIPEKLKPYIPFIEDWNNQPNIKRKHVINIDSPTKTVWNALSLLHLLQAGLFGKIHDIAPDYAKTNGIGPSELSRKHSDDEIRTAIKRFNDMCGPDFGPIYKNKFPKSFEEFLYNASTHTSFFLTLAGPGREPKRSREKIKDQVAYDLYKKAFRLNKMNDIEEAEFIRCVNFVCTRSMDYNDRIGIYSTPNQIKGEMWFKTHIAFIMERYFDQGVFTISHIGNQACWKKYVVWIKSRHGVNLEPNKEEIEKAKKAFHNVLELKAKEEETEITDKMEKDEWDKKKKSRCSEGVRSRYQISASEV